MAVAQTVQRCFDHDTTPRGLPAPRRPFSLYDFALLPPALLLIRCLITISKIATSRMYILPNIMAGIVVRSYIGDAPPDIRLPCREYAASSSIRRYLMPPPLFRRRLRRCRLPLSHTYFTPRRIFADAACLMPLYACRYFAAAAAPLPSSSPPIHRHLHA